MGKLIDRFIEVLDKLPVYAQVIGLFIVIVLIGLIRFLSNEKTKTLILNKLKRRVAKLTSKDLSMHRLFDKKEIYKSKIEQLKFSSPVKTEVFQIILTSKLETDIEMSKEFIGIDVDKLSKTELCNMMISLTSTMISKYEEKAKIELINKYGGDLGHELFDYIMNQPDGFKAKRNQRLERIIYQIDEYLRYSKIFDTNIERIAHFLTEVLFSLRSAILDAEKMFSNMNGGIEKIINKYKK